MVAPTMSSLTNIREEQQFLGIFHEFMMTYQQLAAIKMQQIRDQILQTRRYMDGLADVFVDVESAHKLALKRLTETQKKTSGQVQTVRLRTRKKNGLTALVLVTPDTKFSGAINRSVFEEFSKALAAESQAQIFIIGQVGAQLFAERFSNQEYESFHLPQTINKIGDLKELLKKLIDYEKVDVFYPRFFTLIKQKAVVTNVTGNLSFAPTQEEKEREKRDFLFEPELSSMLKFFEMQIFTSLLQQTINESYLANLGSRIVTLESATQGVSQEFNKLQRQAENLEKSIKNKKQRAQLAGIALW